MALRFDGFHGRFSCIAASSNTPLEANGCQQQESDETAQDKRDQTQQGLNASSLADDLRDILSDDEDDVMSKPEAFTGVAATPRPMHRMDSSMSTLSCATDGSSPRCSTRLEESERSRARKNRDKEGFSWTLPDELLLQVAMRLAWPVVGLTCMGVCKRWYQTLHGDVLWNFFSREHWTADRCTHRHLESMVHKGGWMAFRDWHRRRVWRVFGELQTGWDWLVERLGQQSLSGEAEGRSRQVARKLCKREWTDLYDSVGLLLVEHMEATRLSLLADLPADPEVQPPLAGSPRAALTRGEQAEREEVLRRLVGSWRGVREWVRGLEAVLEPLNALVERENRRLEGGSCLRLAHTPSVRGQAAIAFRDIVLLRSTPRARALGAAAVGLARQDAVELSEARLELLLALQTTLDELDVQDDLTAGSSRGRARLRKVFLQPLRQVHSQQAFAARSGKVRMFGGESDLIYGPGSEGED